MRNFFGKKNNQNFLKNNRGLSIIEVLMTLGIIVIFGGVISGGLSHLFTQKSRLDSSNSESAQVNQIIENIRGSTADYEITYDYTDQGRENALAVENLPMAWDVGVHTKAANCENCLGRYGFVIQQYQGLRGLYLVTLRMTYKKWSVDYKDYQFVVTLK